MLFIRCIRNVSPAQWRSAYTLIMLQMCRLIWIYPARKCNAAILLHITYIFRITCTQIILQIAVDSFVFHFSAKSICSTSKSKYQGSIFSLELNKSIHEVTCLIVRANFAKIFNVNYRIIRQILKVLTNIPYGKACLVDGLV